ncbi:MAG: hypothetical protein JWN86_264 [Planctomycetota bacterium]|nr:hypothetical protein [Planctomycetota bacterium]
MDPHGPISTRHDQPIPRDRNKSAEGPPRSGPPRPGVVTGFGLLLVLPIVLAGLGRMLGLIRGPASLVWAGLGLLVVSKLFAGAAFGIGRGWRKEAASAQRAAFVEGVTLGSLLAFVASLALSKFVILPRSFVLIDWAVTLAVFASFKRSLARPDQHLARRSRENDPAVAAMIRDQRVLLTGENRQHLQAMVQEIRAFGPDLLLVAGLDRSSLRRAGPMVRTISRQAANAGSAREIIAIHRPDVVFFVPGKAHSIRDVALGARQLAGQALRIGCGAFILVVPQRGSPGHRLAERVVQALSGISTTRLILVRVAEGVESSTAAVQILKIAAKERDGTVVTIGRSGGLRYQYGRGQGNDANALWEELDAIEPENMVSSAL